MNTLLLIEDDHRLANMVSEYLQQSGFTVQHAANGLSGLKAVQDIEIPREGRKKRNFSQEISSYGIRFR